jgi:hypothetical protein
MSDTLTQLYDNVSEELENLRKTVETAANELGFVPEESRSGARRLIDMSRNQLLGFEEEWSTLRQQPTTEEGLRIFANRIAVEQEKLSILLERGNYRKNLGVLQQLLDQHSPLPQPTLQITLRPQIDFEIEKINALEKKNQLDPEDQEHLAMHRHNLRILQEMLSGQRPYAPLYLVNSVTVEGQRIQEIDNRLGSL